MQMRGRRGRWPALLIAAVLCLSQGSRDPTIKAAAARPTEDTAGPQDLRLYVANSAGNTVSILAPHARNPIVAEVPLAASPHAVAISPDGSRVYVLRKG